MTWGDKMTKAEVDDIFGEFEIDEDYMIKSKEVISLFVAVKEEEKKEPTPPPVVEEAPPEEEEEEEEGRQVNIDSTIVLIIWLCFKLKSITFNILYLFSINPFHTRRR